MDNEPSKFLKNLLSNAFKFTREGTYYIAD